MKKISLVALFCLLGFSPKVFADYVSSFMPPFTVPYTDEKNVTYDSMIYVYYGDYSSWRYFYYDSTYEWPNNPNVWGGVFMGYYGNYINCDTAWTGEVPHLVCETKVNSSLSINTDVGMGYPYYSNRDIYYDGQVNIAIHANVSAIPEEAPIVTINIDPPAGGSVAIGNNTCDSSNTPCQYFVSEVGNLLSQATANTGYAFGGWMSTQNPHPLSLNGFSGNEEITAMFYKTFPRNTATAGFKQSSGYYGECLEYVEYETELPDDVCTYSAVNCLGQAAMKGYATGNTPIEGAIVIYKQGDDALNNGHAGIIVSINHGEGTMIIHDSNWHNPPDGIVRERTVNISDAGIMGYIYPTP